MEKKKRKEKNIIEQSVINPSLVGHVFTNSLLKPLFFPSSISFVSPDGLKSKV